MTNRFNKHDFIENQAKLGSPQAIVRKYDAHQAEHHVISKGLELKNPSATSCYL